MMCLLLQKTYIICYFAVMANKAYILKLGQNMELGPGIASILGHLVIWRAILWIE